MFAVYRVIPDEDTALAEAGAAAALMMVQSRLHPDSVEAHLIIVVRARPSSWCSGRDACDPWLVTSLDDDSSTDS